MKSWQCDGDEDCADGSDEHKCEEEEKAPCNAESEFYCAADDNCIPKFLVCSGTETVNPVITCSSLSRKLSHRLTNSDG